MSLRLEAGDHHPLEAGANGGVHGLSTDSVVPASERAPSKRQAHGIESPASAFTGSRPSPGRQEKYASPFSRARSTEFLTFQRTLPQPEGTRGVAGARRMPCGYSAKLWGARRAPAAAIFFSSPGRRFAPHLRGVQALRRTVVVPTVPPGTPRWGKVGNLSRAGAPLRSPHEFRSTRDPFAGADEAIISWGMGTGDRFICAFVLSR